MRQKKPTKDILSRIQEAKDDNDWGEISYILDKATENDFYAIKDLKALRFLLFEFIEHHYWVLRASTVDFIGGFRLKAFLNLVKKRLQDKNYVVRDYALMAYYELMGAKALPVIEEWCSSNHVSDRVTALALHYIEKRDKDSFNKLNRIIKDKRCNPIHICEVIQTFDYYCDGHPQREIVTLIKNILHDIPKSHWVAKDVRRMLRKWTRPEEKKRS